jgi:hypothetical protein
MPALERNWSKIRKSALAALAPYVLVLLDMWQYGPASRVGCTIDWIWSPLVRRT